MVLGTAMLLLIIGLFALCAGLVRFCDDVIDPGRERAAADLRARRQRNAP